MLLLLGAGVLTAGAGLATLLEGCAPVAPVAVTLQVDTRTMPVGAPVSVPFSMTNTRGDTIQAMLWLLKDTDGSLTAFDSRCTHALCVVKWAPADGKFKCNCHGGEYAIDGTVLAGPPPRPLNRFPVTDLGRAITVEVPGDFAVPRESLGA